MALDATPAGAAADSYLTVAGADALAGDDVGQEAGAWLALANATPADLARKEAALKTAAVSGTLALPPGPLGIAVILPDLVAVWRIQAQMVADIAAAFGKSGSLAQEQMIYCLFRHAAAQVVRDLAMRVGERVVYRQATLRLLQATAQKLGVKVSQRVIAKSAARWIPILGSLGVAGYAYYDTAQVGATAVDLFQRDFDSDSADSGSSDGL